MELHGIKTFSQMPLYCSETAVVSESCNCGSGLADDKDAFTKEDSFMYIISKTCLEEFESFIAAIPQKELLKFNNDAGVYYTFKIDGSFYYIYYTYAEAAVRVIQDNSTNALISELDFGDEAENVRIFQYSLNYEQGSVAYAEEGFIDCGMLYIILFPDGSVILVDSAHGNQTTAASLEGFYKFLKKITATPDNEKIKVRAWFFTHAHGDHLGFAAAFLGKKYRQIESKELESYADRVDIAAVIFNFPSYHVAVENCTAEEKAEARKTFRKRYYALEETVALRAALRGGFPDVKYIKLHTGQQFSVFGMRFEVLYSWEDSVNDDGTWALNECNSTCVVMKLTYKDKSIMLLADTTKIIENVLTSHYKESTLRADIVQVAHHGINKLDIYEVIGARYAFAPTSYNLMVGKNYEKYCKFKDVATGGIYCADAKTWEAEISSRGLRFCEHPRYDAVM